MNPSWRDRKGFTLILMTVMLTILIGAAAFAVDFGEMYLYKAQLQSAADAAALAGVLQFSRNGGTESRDTAIVYDTRHNVGTSSATLAAADVLIGTWTTPTGPFTADADQTNGWTNTSANDAVQAVTRYTGSYGFGRLFGLTTKDLHATAVAAWGSANASTCVRPWAVPYQSMLDVLYPPGTKNAATYTLTGDDITRLSVMTSVSNPVQLKVGTAGDLTPNGEFYAAQLPPLEYADGTAGTPWTGGSNYRSAIGDTCAQLGAALLAQGGPGTVSVGDYLNAETGNVVGPTKQGVDDLCGGGGTCSPPIKLVVALWDFEGPSPGGNCTTVQPCYHVKYLGVFTLTGYDQANKAVNGYFNTMVSQTAAGFTTSGGGAGAGASPIQIFALVK